MIRRWWLGYLERPHVWLEMGYENWKTLSTVIGVIVVLLAAVVLLFTKEAIAVRATGFDWDRQYDIENWQANAHQGWYYPPSTAYNIRREWRQSGTTRHEICSGSGKDRHCTSWYTPDYDWYYWYTNDEWTYDYSLKNIGFDTASPLWPEAVPAACSEIVFGCKRIGAAWEHYRLTVKSPRAESWTCEFDQTRWSGYTLEEQFNLTVGKYTRIPDCFNLKPQ